MPTRQTIMPILLVIALLVNSCIHSDDPVQIIADSTGHIIAVHLSPKEIEHAGIKHGSITKQEVDRWVPCSGNLVVSPENTIDITSPATGRIISLSFSTGQYVKTGSMIAGLESIDFITLQQEYLDARNQFDYLREEYARQGNLTVENATSMKKMQIAKRDYQSAELQMCTLQAQLEILGIRSDSLKYDKLSPLIHILAPGSGFISDKGIHLGSYIKKGDALFELINIQHLLIKLKVSEQYVRYLQKGQFVDFWLVHDTLSAYKARLSLIAREIDPASHSITVYAALSERKAYFIPGMSVNAKINADKKTVICINSNSIIQCSAGVFLFVKTKGNYTRIPIIKGNAVGEMTEISGLSNELADSVVVEGAEYLHSLYERP
jgi:cobalt-zinc-cadmium efflux system membrane fusion protein